MLNTKISNSTYVDAPWWYILSLLALKWYKAQLNNNGGVYPILIFGVLQSIPKRRGKNKKQPKLI